MAESYTYDGGALLTVRELTTELTLSAELGAVGNGTIIIDDSDGDEEIVGQKDFSHEESACSIPLTFSGFINERTYRRGATMNETARDIEVSLVDLNAMLGFLLIDGDDGNRPRETVEERADWLMASDYVGFSDLGRCTFSADVIMTKSDYRNQYAGDVLADMALASGGGTNYHVNDYGSGPELTFRNDNTSTADSSTLRISNVLTDQTSVTLYPFKDATLSRSPADVYSKIAFSNAKTTIYEERAATATDFNGERGGQASNSNVNTSAAARLAAQDLLWQHSTEEDSITCTVETTDAQVNLMPPGWRIQAKFSHLATEGYGSFTWFRILEVTKKPIVADGSLYHVTLKLSPQEEGPPVVGIVQRASIRTVQAGGVLTLPNPVTPGNHLVYAISARRVGGDPPAPNIAPSLERFGAGAWTRFNGTQESAASTIFGTQDDGCAMFWKVADSTSSTGYVSSYSIATVWELAGSDPSAATLEYINAATGGPDYQTASLGTVAVGDIVLGVFCIGEYPGAEWAWGGPGAPPSGGRGWCSIFPTPGISAGLDVQISQWAYDHYSVGYYIPAEPWGITYEGLGAGAAIQPTVTPGESGHGFGAVAVVIPPA